MCEPGKKLKLCTCLVSESRDMSRKKMQDGAKTYQWTLTKLLGPSEFVMDGMLIEPDRALDQNLTAEQIVGELNGQNCFDFDYAPSDDDNLVIYEKSKNAARFVSFIYKNGKWSMGSHDTFASKTEVFNQGKVRFE